SVAKSAASEDELLGTVLEAGAEDMRDDGLSWEVLTPPEAFDGVLAAVKSKKIEPENAEVAMVPQNYIKLEGKDAEQMLKLLDAIDDSDDVTHVYSNFDMDESSWPRPLGFSRRWHNAAWLGTLRRSFEPRACRMAGRRRRPRCSSGCCARSPHGSQSRQAGGAHFSCLAGSSCWASTLITRAGAACCARSSADFACLPRPEATASWGCWMWTGTHARNFRLEDRHRKARRGRCIQRRWPLAWRRIFRMPAKAPTWPLRATCRARRA